MSDFNILPTSIQGLGISERAQETTPSTELGQDDFLNLLVTQLQNQDPLNPAEGSEFVAQLAEFSTVSGITDLNTSFDDLAASLQSNRALEASTMVGRTVLVNSNTAQYQPGQTVQGTVSVDAPIDGDVIVTVYNSAGEIVRDFNAGQPQDGRVDFSWDGLNDEGDAVGEGEYEFNAVAVIGGDNFSLPLQLSSKVTSVTVPPDGSEAILNIAGVGSVPLRSIREIL